MHTVTVPCKVATRIVKSNYCQWVSSVSNQNKYVVLQNT